jgi:hypothetical protein
MVLENAGQLEPRRSALEDEDADALAGGDEAAGDGESPPGDGGDGDRRRARETSAERGESPPEKRARV